MANLIDISGLVKRYDGFTLGPLDLTLPEGEVLGLIGSNGAGKTTTIKALLGLIRPDAGTLALFGDTQLDSAAVRERLGVVFDTCAFPATAHVEDIERIGRSSYANWDGALFAQHARNAGLDPSKAVKDLSRGMGMRLSLAFALAHHPQLLILDEPTAGLDPIARVDVLDVLRDYMDETRGILISTHITTDLEHIADQVFCIDGGQPVFAAPKDDICSVAGVAHCRAGQVEALLASGLFPTGSLRIMGTGYSTDVLVPNRFTLAERLPDVVCEPATIESYMTFMLRGDAK